VKHSGHLVKRHAEDVKIDGSQRQPDGVWNVLSRRERFGRRDGHVPVHEVGSHSVRAGLPAQGDPQHV
jgi:hypothetical protein